MSNDEVFGEFTLRKEVESEHCGMGDHIDFTWHSVYVGEPDPYKGALAKFKVRQHADAFIKAASKAVIGALN